MSPTSNVANMTWLGVHGSGSSIARLSLSAAWNATIEQGLLPSSTLSFAPDGAYRLALRATRGTARATETTASDGLQREPPYLSTAVVWLDFVVDCSAPGTAIESGPGDLARTSTTTLHGNYYHRFAQTMTCVVMSNVLLGQKFFSV